MIQKVPHRLHQTLDPMKIWDLLAEATPDGRVPSGAMKVAGQV